MNEHRPRHMRHEPDMSLLTGPERRILEPAPKPADTADPFDITMDVDDLAFEMDALGFDCDIDNDPQRAYTVHNRRGGCVGDIMRMYPGSDQGIVYWYPGAVPPPTGHDLPIHDIEPTFPQPPHNDPDVAHRIRPHELIAAFRWIMATYTASGADGPAPFPWCDNYVGDIPGIGFDPDAAVAAIDAVSHPNRR